MKWTIIKVLSAQIYADFGCQTTTMAMRKNNDAIIRAQHVAWVAGAFGAALATDDQLSISKKALVILINTAAHFLIDGFRLNKALDQALHSIVAVSSVWAVKR
jgi:hypothetical protein